MYQEPQWRTTIVFSIQGVQFYLEICPFIVSYQVYIVLFGFTCIISLYAKRHQCKTSLGSSARSIKADAKHPSTRTIPLNTVSLCWWFYVSLSKSCLFKSIKCVSFTSRRVTNIKIASVQKAFDVIFRHVGINDVRSGRTVKDTFNKFKNL